MLLSLWILCVFCTGWWQFTVCDPSASSVLETACAVYRTHQKLVLVTRNATILLCTSLKPNDDIQVSVHNKVIQPKTRPLGRYDAVYGLCELPHGPVLAVVKASTPLELRMLPGIRQVNQIELVDVPFSVPSRVLTSAQANARREAKRLLLQTIHRQQFLFSTDHYQIHQSFQTNMMHCANNILFSSNNNSSSSNITHSSNSFQWNRRQLRPFAHCNVTALSTPMVSCWIRQEVFSVDNVPLSLTFLAKRASSMQGTR
jgi:hypothetical protein